MLFTRQVMFLSVLGTFIVREVIKKMKKEIETFYLYKTHNTEKKKSKILVVSRILRKSELWNI